MPILVLDDGSVLTEGAVIVQYIADQVPQRNLAPANGTMARYHLQEWLNFIASEIHKGFGPLWVAGSSEEAKKMALERLEKRFTLLEQQLADQDYLMGDFCVVDAYLFTCLSWTAYLKVSLKAYPKLQKYLERVAARTLVQQVLKVEGLI